MQEHAETLHKSFPDMYKDPNHKPELAIALTPFEALCGFRLLAQIKEYLRSEYSNYLDILLLITNRTHLFNECVTN